MKAKELLDELMELINNGENEIMNLDEIEKIVTELGEELIRLDNIMDSAGIV